MASLLQHSARFFPRFFTRTTFLNPSIGSKKFPFQRKRMPRQPPLSKLTGARWQISQRRTREGENRCYAVCITDVIKITEVRAAMHNG